jgi:TolA-binding protein
MIEFKNQNGPIAALLCLTASLGGCAAQFRDAGNNPRNTQTNDTVAQRFEEPETSNSTLIESAVELSDKYAKLTAKMAELQQLNQALQQENGQLKLSVESLETQTKQLEAQLDESNRLVMDLNGELQMWKKDILGFRSEMRAAATAQINALMKIMTAMGVDKDSDDLVSEEIAVDQPIQVN